MDNKTVEINISDLNFLLELVTRLQKTSLTSSVENRVLELVLQRLNQNITQNNKVDENQEIE